MNNCLRIQERLFTSYIDGMSTAEETAAIDSHLLACAACCTALAAIRETELLLKNTPRAPVPVHLWSDVCARIETENENTLSCRLTRRLDLVFGILPQKAWIGLATFTLLAGSLPLLINTPAMKTVPDESAALISMSNEREQMIFSDDVNLDTNTEYYINYKGELT